MKLIKRMNKITYKKGVYFWQGKDQSIPKKAGFKFSNKLQVWGTRNALKAWLCDADIKPRNLESFDEQVAVSRMKEPLGKVGSNLSPEGLEYLPYQGVSIIAAQNLYNTQRAILIADEMGLGKTIQALGIYNALRCKRSLIVCPASIKLNWAREFVKWTTDDTSVCILKSKKDYINPNANAIIVNYDLLTSGVLAKQLAEMDFGLIVLDEIHYLKNPKSKRTKAVLGINGRGGIVSSGNFIVALTGTPIPNKPIELYPMLASLSPDTIDGMGYFEFARYFCGAYKDRFGLNVNGSKNEKELNKRLRATFMICRKKKDVLKDLPDKTHQVIYLTQDAKANKLIKREGGYDAKELLSKGTSVAFEGLAELRRELAEIKAPYVASHIEDMLNDGLERVVVFAHHKEVINILVEKLKPFGVVKIDGSVSQNARQEAVDTFQSGGARVFIGNIQAAGVGITLTAASTVVFAEFSWVPGENQQAVDRCHRIGQKDNVLAQYLVYPDSLDAYIIGRSLQKQETINKLME